MASVAKVIELIASSEKSFDDAVQQGLAVAAQSLRGITGIDIKHHSCVVVDNRITQYKVTIHVAFAIERGA